jgi:hypothetical protein
VIVKEAGNETLWFWTVFLSPSLQSIVHDKGHGCWDKHIFGNCMEDNARWSCIILDLA